MDLAYTCILFQDFNERYTIGWVVEGLILWAIDAAMLFFFAAIVKVIYLASVENKAMIGYLLEY